MAGRAHWSQHPRLKFVRKPFPAQEQPAQCLGNKFVASPIQYAFAHEWPLKIYLGMCVGLCLAGSVHVCEPGQGVFRDWPYLFWLLAVIILAAVLGFYLALPFAWMLLGPLYRLQARRNGAPFAPGDYVRVLVGPHRGRVVRVREHWQADNLRVDLGPAADTQYQDIFSPTQLLREPIDEPVAHSTAHHDGG